MIGGAMLLCAVGAMLLLAWWSIARDDAPDTEARDGVLALRTFGEAVKRKATKTNRRPAPRRAAQRPAVQKLKKLDFDPDEMAEIAIDANATLPRFLRDAREEY